MGLGRAVIGKHGRDENAGPVRRDGRVFYRSTKATSKTVHTLSGCVLASAVPLAGKPVVLAGRRKPGPASTSRVQRRTAMLLCHCTPADGAEILERGMNPSSSCLKRLLTRAGERWNEKESAARDAIREAETVPEEAASCTVSLDGVMVPLRPDGDREACWREASCGTVSFHDGNRLRTVSFARMPEAGKATLKEQLAAEVAHVRKVRPDLPLVAVADAAPDNWTFLEELQPDEWAVDFFHACEHLAEVADHAVATDWYDRYRAVLRDDERGVDKVVRAISAARRRDRRSRFSTASLHSSARTGARYASLKAKGYPVGSGVVEAANKMLVNQRMKRAGQRWSVRSERPYLQGDVGPLRRGWR